MDVTDIKKDNVITCRLKWENGSETFYPDPISVSNIFSKREIQIAKYIQQGNTSKAIAIKLFIAEDTVKNHRKNILKKANAKNMMQAIEKMKLRAND